MQEPWKSRKKIKILTCGSRFTEGYLSRLRAGDGVPSASLVSLLALLSKEPARLDELARYWALPLAPEPRARRRRQGP